MNKSFINNNKVLPHKIKNLNRNNLQTICRTCLEVLQSTSVSTRYCLDNYNIRNAPALKELLKTFALLNINEKSDEVFPQRLCSNCYHTLNEFQYFRDMVQQSSEWLRKVVENDAMEIKIINETDVIIKVEKETAVVINVEKEPDVAIKVEKETEIDARFKVEPTCDYGGGDDLLEETRSEIFSFRSMSEADRSNDIELESEAEYIRRINNSLEIKVENEWANDVASNENDPSVDETDRHMVNAFKDEIDIQPSTSKEAAAKNRRHVTGTSAAKFKCLIEGCWAGFTKKQSLQVHKQNFHCSVDLSNMQSEASIGHSVENDSQANARPEIRTKKSTERVRRFRARRKALLKLQRNISFLHNNTSAVQNIEYEHHDTQANEQHESREKNSTERVRRFRARRKALLNVQHKSKSIAYNNRSTIQNSENDQHDSQVDVSYLQGDASIRINSTNNDFENANIFDIKLLQRRCDS